MSWPCFMPPVTDGLILREERRRKAVRVGDISTAVIAHVDNQPLALFKRLENPVDIPRRERVGEAGIIDISHSTAIYRVVIQSACNAAVLQIQRLQPRVKIGRTGIKPRGVGGAVKSGIEIHMSVVQRVQHPCAQVKKRHLVVRLDLSRLGDILLADGRPVDAFVLYVAITRVDDLPKPFDIGYIPIKYIFVFISVNGG